MLSLPQSKSLDLKFIYLNFQFVCKDSTESGILSIAVSDPVGEKCRQRSVTTFVQSDPAYSPFPTMYSNFSETKFMSSTTFHYLVIKCCQKRVFFKLQSPNTEYR